MGHDETPPGLESGLVLPSGRTSSDNSQHFPDKAEIERLGRARPAVLPSLVTEVFFVVTIVLSMTMSEYFIGGFNIVLPPIADALAMPEDVRTWPAGVINLTTAAFLMPFSRLCDMYGARSVFLFGHVWYMIWSLVCGFSTNTVMLIICRALQGIGTSAFTPAGLALLGQTYRPGPRKNLATAGGLINTLLYLGLAFWLGIAEMAVSEANRRALPEGLSLREQYKIGFWIGVALAGVSMLMVVTIKIDRAAAELTADEKAARAEREGGAR
ncbi:MFS general substrate transporter [Trichoderma longibrachiatum ATCC 18648]|uniref:MFS general substrate transporter n=1 Tax=Trichoderma longibrachiatum ATCC 18648 TaxID=983965 RepID=A0A2T4CBT9_TRILO|nr:MFS general substrate transporter [Trichoderma longibrachiatum ATCC 18648]